MTEYLPTDTEAVTDVTLRPWLGKRVYIDLGDSYLHGGELTGVLTGISATFLTIKEHDLIDIVTYDLIQHIEALS